MGVWTDLATWRGPTVNRGRNGDRDAAAVEHRGVVIHIAEGWYEGTIAWQRNPDSRVSSHFVIGREHGQAAQMVDTDHIAWTQGDGNGRWISFEFEGFTPGHRLWQPGWHQLTDWQLDWCARGLARANREYRSPIQLAASPAGRGLGHHSMGAENGANWGHSQCPGPAIKAQKPEIVSRAKELIGGKDTAMTTAADVWAYDPDNAKAAGAVRNQKFRPDHKSNATVAPRWALEESWRLSHEAVQALTAVRREQTAAAARDAAILAALTDPASTAEIIAAVDARLIELRTVLAQQLGAELLTELGDRLGDLSDDVLINAVVEATRRVAGEVAAGPPAT